MFPEILNRLREGKQTEDDIMKIKKRCTDDKNCPRQAPRLFIQNAMVDDYNQTVYQTSTTGYRTSALCLLVSSLICIALC